MDQRRSEPRTVAEERLREMGYVQRESVWRVLDMPARLRPREAMARLGAEGVADAALLAVILRSGVRGANVVDLAADLLQHYGSLSALGQATVEELTNVKGIGPVKAQIIVAAMELVRRAQEEQAADDFKIRTPADVAVLLAAEVRRLDTETFWVLHLNPKNVLKGKPVAVTRGLLDVSLVHPREVFRGAIRTATSAVVLAHNHPSGDCSPSAEDIRITRQLVEAGRIVDIRVLDHVIVGRGTTERHGGFISLREEGIVKFD